MKSVLKKLACFVMLFAMLGVLLAGCTGTTTTPATTTKGETSQTTTAGTSAEGTTAATEGTTAAETTVNTEPVTFTAYTSDSSVNTKWGQDPVSQKITELTGVTLDMEFTVGNLNEKIGVMLASGDYPDMLLSINNENVAQLQQAGVLVDVEPYIEPYGTNIKKIFGDKIGAMRSEIDSKIYGFNREFGGMPTNSPVNIQIQYAMLKDAGYPKIKTLDELYELIKNYVATNPTYEGKDVIGLSAWGASWGFNVTFNNAALRASGYQDDGNFYINPDTLEAKYGLTTDAAKLYIKWLNKMNAANLFDKDSFVQTSEAFQSKIISGRVLVASNAWWDIEPAEAALRKDGKDDRCYAELPIYVSEEAAANSRINYYDPLGSWKSVITTNCKDPERVFQFFDTMWSEDMQVLCNWGIEGVSYDVDASGKRVMKPDYQSGPTNDDMFASRTGIGAYYYWSTGPMYKGTDGQYLNPYTVPEIQAALYTDLDNEVLHAYNPDALTWVDLAPKPLPSPWGFAWKLTVPSDSEGAIAQNKVENEIRVNAIVSLVEAKDDTEFEDKWQSFLTQCKDAGIEKREAEITAALKTRMELWYN